MGGVGFIRDLLGGGGWQGVYGLVLCFVVVHTGVSNAGIVSFSGAL